MSDLLNKVKVKALKLSEENINIAREKCQEADNFIMQARKSGGSDKTLIIKAIELYKESLALHSRQPQPYIGIAYISYSAGDLKEAIGMLNMAQQIEPNNQQIDQMLELFNEELTGKNISSVISKAAGKSLAEFSKKPAKSMLDKLASIFMTSVKKAKKETKEKEKVQKAQAPAMTAKPSGKADFYSLINETRKSMNYPGTDNGS